MMTNLSKLNWCKKWILKSCEHPDELVFIKLAGDGSSRIFYRITLASKSFVLIDDPNWTMTRDYFAHRNFLNDHGIVVPNFIAQDPALGLLLMQDLGDTLLQTHIHNNPEQKLKLLHQSIRILADMHSKTFNTQEKLPYQTRCFDAAKYYQELNYTVLHLHQTFLKQENLLDLIKIEKFCQDISNILPLVFCHRDFQTRNIMVRNLSELVLIDFQDARLGPIHYDIASLLYDPYMPLSKFEKQDLLNSYKAQLNGTLLDSQINWKNFDNELIPIAFQRVIKAAGSFAAFFNLQNKTTHLKYIKPALECAFDLQNQGTIISKDLFPIPMWLKQFELSKWEDL